MALISDESLIAEIKQEWAAVKALASKQGVYPGLPGYSAVIVPPPAEFYNLPLVLAYSTLDDVLGAFIDGGSVTCKKKSCFKLGDKMLSAKTAIGWIDYALVDEGRIARNGVAHENRLVEKADCLKYIEAVGKELTGWGLIS